MVSSFTHKIPSVCAAVATSTVQRCTLQPTIWTQAPYHPSCRLVYNHLSIMILMCILLYMYLLTGTNTGGGNVDFWCATDHVPVPTIPHGQYAYSGHVINLPQDVASQFANSLPRMPSDLDVIVVRKEGAVNSHRHFRVRKSVVLSALRWLLTNNKYYRSVSINHDALVLLPEDGNLTGLRSVTLD